MSDSQPTEPTTADAATENHPAQPAGTTESTDASTSTEPTLPLRDDVTDTSASGAEAGETLGADTPGEASTTVKDPSEWVTGDEPMTGAQRSYLDTLARAAGEQLPADLNKAQASEHIDRLQSKTGRGAS